MWSFSLIITSLFAGLITYYINHYLNKGPVFASAVVALCSGLVLPLIFENGTTLALVATCASYAGMSAKVRIAGFVEMSLATILCALVFIISQNALVGHGGRLGTIAAISVITIWGAKQVFAQATVAISKGKLTKTEKQTN